MHKNTAKSRIRAHAGFTLLELLIVMTISAIVVMIALPNIDYSKARVNSSGRQLTMTLLASQRLAMLRQYSVVVSFDAVHRLVRVHEDRNNNGQIETGEPVNYVQLEDGVEFGRGMAPVYSPLGGAAISFTKSEGGLPAVTFTRNGSAGEMGGFYITSVRAGASTQYRAEVRACEVNRATGRPTLYAYTGTDWRRSF